MFTTLRAVLPGRGDEMPADVLEREVRVDRDALAAYAHVTGFTLRDELPPTYPHVLAFPLHMELLARAPFSAVGVVHIANRITQHRPLRFGEALSLQVSVSELRPHRRGRAFDLLTEVRVGDELVWEVGLDQPQARRRRRVGRATRGPSRTRRSPPWWTLPDDLGRRYAGVSGDHNPIHLHGWSAKPFGFPRAIAHGMWTKARCLSSLRLPDAFTAEVRFKKPVLLPSKVKFGEAEDRFAVLGHLEGVLERVGVGDHAVRQLLGLRQRQRAGDAAREQRDARAEHDRDVGDDQLVQQAVVGELGGELAAAEHPQVAVARRFASSRRCGRAAGPGRSARPRPRGRAGRRGA